MQSLHDSLAVILKKLNISNNAIAHVNEKLLEARQALRNHRQELDLLTDITDQLQARVDNHEHRLNNLEVRKAIDRTFMAWKSERTYQGFYWAIQVAFITREIVDYTLTDYERSTRDLECRQYLIDSLIVASENIIPDNYFSLLELLNSAHDHTLLENRKIATYLLEVELIPSERLSRTPYLFALGKTLELAQLSEENRPKNAAQAALELCRNRKMFIYAATSRQQFIESIVNETANDRLKR
jgi:hypothetical protein